MKKLLKAIFIPVALAGLFSTANVSLFASASVLAGRECDKGCKDAKDERCRQHKCHFKMWCCMCKKAAEEGDYKELERLVKHKEAHIKHWKQCLSKNEKFLKEFKSAVKEENDDKITNLIDRHEKEVEKMKEEHCKMCKGMCKTRENYKHKKMHMNKSEE